MTNESRSKLLLGLILSGILLVSPSGRVDAGHNHVWGELRVDHPDIYLAQVFQITIMALDKPSNGFPDYVDGYIGLELDNQCSSNPVFGCAQFVQVGILAKTDGVRWFIFAEPGVVCHRGNQAWGSLGCEGSITDFINIGTWYRMEMQKQTNNWVAVIYDTYNNPYTVATINSTSQRIYKAYIDMEEAYGAAQDPHMIAKFNFYHPRYSNDGYTFFEWPESTGEILNGNKVGSSFILAGDDFGQNAFCPSIYGFEPPSFSDERYWYIGTPDPDQGKCEGLLLPSKHNFLSFVGN